ncbi:MAG: adenylate/guanylate cyclase domain-containing protein [Clostridiales bacterium]|nr:adenylate/guanylate cyclase domain-containing protein [Clostridiales bacterium]
MKKNLYKDLVISLLSSLLIIVLIGAGILQRPDKWFQDYLFQRSKAVPDDILIIGIDDKAIEEIGPYDSWDRGVMASALEVLASDPDNMPSVVAIDTLYQGSTDPEIDKRLADAAGKLNTVTATSAVFGTKHIFDEDNEVTINDYAVIEYDEPYDELKANSTQGHINAMYDDDGIMRHGILYIDTTEGERVYSMPYMTASIYMEQHGETLETPKTNSRGQFYIPYSAKPEGYYDGLSISDLINGRIPSSLYAGKIVLIGPHSVGLQDSYFTPIEKSKMMYGVEIQANIIQSFIDPEHKQEVGTLPLMLITFIISFAATFCFLRSKINIAAIAALVFSICGIVILLIIYNSGYVTHPFWLIIAVVPTFLIAAGVHYFRSAMEKQSVVRTFARYVAPNIVGEILKEGTENLSLGGKTCNIAVLFVDVRGFTTMSEKMEPEKVVKILNKYLTMVSYCVEQNEGTLDKFIGDAAMAFWGAPIAQEDPVYYAAKTAVAIIDGAKKVSRELKKEMGVELNVGVGIHYGPAVVGNMGSERHMDYTAIGDTVNTASRLESNAPGGTIYISRCVAEELKDVATFTSLGNTVKLKGKSNDFEVLTLDSLKEKDHA